MSGCPTIKRPARQLGEEDNAPSSNEDGASNIDLLLYCLLGICLLVFTYGLCCLAFRYPYVVTPIAFCGAVLFSIMAFRGKPKKGTNSESTKEVERHGYDTNDGNSNKKNLQSMSPKRKKQRHSVRHESNKKQLKKVIKIDGKPYEIVGWAYDKNVADDKVNEIRAKGSRARVLLRTLDFGIPTYVVYKRKQKLPRWCKAFF
jgi:hypothetical protein